MAEMNWKAEKGLKIAVIGGGVSGITTAYCLSRRHRVVLLEKEDQLGGHTYTVTIPDGPDEGLPVDMGFIVMNDRTYPLLNRMLDQLKVERSHTDMSFSYHDPHDQFIYAGTGINGLFARRKNLVTPSFWRMLWDIARFCRRAIEDLEAGHLRGMTLGQYAGISRTSQIMMQRYIIPMAAAIWSGPEDFIRSFPAETFVRFFQNHGLMTIKDRPKWLYIRGGSRTYVQAFEKVFPGKVLTGTPVRSIRRANDHVLVKADNGQGRFDAVVLATHADVSRSIVSDPSPLEKSSFAPWKYTDNTVVLHTDTSFLPPVRRGWASWNFRNEPDIEEPSVRVSYHMNRLQRLKAEREYIVTLNPSHPPHRESIVHQAVMTHPQFSLEALTAQRTLAGCNGQNRTFYCGSYMGYGFHEDGVRSAVRVAECFGIEL